jgi:hypothetical protein
LHAPAPDFIFFRPHSLGGASACIDPPGAFEAARRGDGYAREEDTLDEVGPWRAVFLQRSRSTCRPAFCRPEPHILLGGCPKPGRSAVLR